MHRYENMLLDLCQLLIEEYLLEKKKNHEIWNKQQAIVSGLRFLD